MAYASTTDLTRLGLPAEALTGVSTATQEDALDAASSVADGYLRPHHKVLPLASWGDDLRRAVCAIAAWDLLVTRGFNPSTGGDQAVLTRYEHAIAWCKDVSAGRVQVSGGNTTPEATRHARADAPRVSSDRTRGW